jgi:diguanylate cyclase (GGDEF)-like protein/PAS domain S-box-containing protein
MTVDASILFRPNRSQLVGGLVFLFAVALAAVLVWNLNERSIRAERERVAHVAAEHAHTIEHTIERALSATHVLAALLHQGDGRIADFEDIAAEILSFYPGVSSLALAPDGIVRHIAPLSGNENALGLDLMTTPALRKESLLARDSGRLTLAGPLELSMGGPGLVGRLPVYLGDDRGEPAFWGFAIAVIRLPDGLDIAHLSRLNEQGLAYELWRIHPDTGEKQVITHTLPVPLIEPVVQVLQVPNASWMLSIAPIKGWGRPLALYTQAVLGLLFSLMLAYLAKMLVDMKRQRQVLEARVAERTAGLSQAQRRLKAILDAIPDPVWLKDADGIYLSCNPKFEWFLGAREAEIVGKTDYDFVSHEQAEFFREHDRKAMTAGKPSMNEEWLTFASEGVRRLFETIKTPLLDEDGKIVGVLGIARDITKRAEAEHALLQSRQQTQQYLEIVGVILIVLDAEGRVRLVNRKGCEMLGVAEADILGKDWIEHFLPERLRAEMREFFTLLMQGNAVPVEYVENAILTRGGQERDVAWNNVILRDESGKIIGVLSSGEDITERKQSEKQLGLAAKVFEQSSESIMITDAQRNIVMVNQAFTAITGYSEAEVLGRNPRMLSSGRQDRTFYETMWEAISTQGRWQGEMWNLRKDGSLYPEMLTIIRVHGASGEVSGYIGISSDITLSKAAQERIQRLAHFDPLTGLPNRVLLNDRISHELSAAQRRHTTLAIMFVDLDHFKNINDTLGHRIGDELLIRVASRLKSTVRDVDTVSRQGGDEFVLILPDTDADGAAHVSGKLLEVVAQPYQIESLELIVTLSIGIALYPGDGENFDTLSRCADAAMYRAKHDGRNTYRFFTAEMQSHSARSLQMESALRRALERKQLLLHYQPQISLRDGGIIGAEALLRWQHPELGMVPPAEFIPIAEESGQILQIGEWVLRTVIRQMKTWMDAGIAPMMMAANLSAVQFRHPQFPELVARILDEESLAPAYLELELTESVAMGDAPTAIEIMDSLHARGIHMSIDDFGTGYSSLSYLKRFRVYKLKIDQSFVRDIGKDPEDRAIVIAIISLANSLGLQTIAEGVETEEQLTFLREQGCDEVQGYYFSKPLPADEFEAFVRTWRSPSFRQ